MAVGLGVVGSVTVTGMTPEFTAPLNQTGGGNGTGGAVETGSGSGSASGTGIGGSGNENGSVPAAEQFTGAGVVERSVSFIVALVGVAVLFGVA
jgi:hypothetical protein